MLQSQIYLQLGKLLFEYLTLNNFNISPNILDVIIKSLDIHLSIFIKKLKVVAELSSRKDLISLDFLFILEEDDNFKYITSNIDNSHISIHSKIYIPITHENKRCPPPTEHSYKFTKTKGFRNDDLFVNRKRKTIQFHHIETSIDYLCPRTYYNYDM